MEMKADICSHRDTFGGYKLFRWGESCSERGCNQCPSIRIGRGQAEARFYPPAERGRRWRMEPRASQMPSAIHSVGEKWPGITGKTFIRNSNSDTTIPSPVTA